MPNLKLVFMKSPDLGFGLRLEFLDGDKPSSIELYENAEISETAAKYIGWRPFKLKKLMPRMYLLLALLALARKPPPKSTAPLFSDSAEVGHVSQHTICGIPLFFYKQLKQPREWHQLQKEFRSTIEIQSSDDRDKDCLLAIHDQQDPKQQTMFLRLDQSQIEFEEEVAEALLRRIFPERASCPEPLPIAEQEPARPPPPPPPTSIDPPGGFYNPSCYVHREAEEVDAMEYLQRPRTPVVLQGPEGYGKGTFVGWLLAWARESLRPVRIRQLRLSQESACLADLTSLLICIIRKLLLDVDPGQAERWWAEAEARPNSAQVLFSSLLEERVLSDPRVELTILAIERVDLIWGRSYQDQFFSMLRAWCEEEREPWTRLRLVLTVATEPALLDTTDNSGFFVGRPIIQLPELTLKQIHELAVQHGLEPSEEEVAKLHTLVGGHPHLARHACYRSRRGGLNALLTDPAQQKEAFRSYLLRQHQWLEQHPLLKEELRAMLADRDFRPNPERSGRIYSKGLIREAKEGGVELSSQLYKDYFGPLLTMVGTT